MRSRWGTGSLVIAATLLTLHPLLATRKSQKDDIDDIGSRRVAHRSIISEEREEAIGKQYAAQVDRNSKLVKESVISEYVNHLAQNMAGNSDVQIPIRAKVIDSPEINAFALPGGFIYVNTGLLQAAGSQAQLAGVLAHEIAHVAARHWASEMTKRTILSYAWLPLMVTPMSFPVYMGVSEAMNFGIPLAFLKFSRADETEADFLGIQYLHKAGYDPNAYIAIFGKILQEERTRPGSVPNVFADHPPTGDRIISAEEEIQHLLPRRQEYLVTTSEFNDVQARLETVMAQLRKPEQSGPTLRRHSSDTSTTGTDDSDDDKPPVLRRRD